MQIKDWIYFLINLAVTVFAAFMVTVQVVPEATGHPIHPVKVDPVAGFAIILIVLHAGKLPELNQAEAPRVPRAVPEPVPVFVMERE